MSIRKLNIIWCSLVVIIVAVGTIYHITWEKKQTVMDDPLHWFKSEQKAINYAKEGQSSGNLTLLRGTSFIAGKKAIPAYFKNKRDGEGFIIIEIERKNGRYTSLLNNAGAAVSYPPGLSEGQDFLSLLSVNRNADRY